ncbi:DUF998 domain-containing protein [Aerococcaceae bacterium DSM 109653]|uniref:DUF998 domain-containing protein n=1 Tax=Fundicoccus ignavus TaxID=2664442 RepID=A0A844BXI8_9LACT|nr:DUF998 domain-containing protein [Fundicoccus ignavus]MRI81157.1 DUF998 domain-containing protein [Fundicoccus ignavus]
MTIGKDRMDLYLPSNQVLDLAQKDQIQLVIEGHRYNLASASHHKGNQVAALRQFLIPSSIVTVIFFLFFLIRGQGMIALTGDFSISSMVTLLGVSSGVISFAYYFVTWKKQGKANLEKVYWRNFPTLLLSFTIIILLALMLSFYVISTLFVNLSLDLYLSTLFAFILFAVVHYLMIHFVLILSPSVMTKLLVFVIVGGVLFAMITNNQEEWWQVHLSFLGSNQAASSWQFNVTLILSALLMIALIDYIFVSLKETFPKHVGAALLRILLTVTAVSLGLVGYFPADGPGNMPLYHNKAAEMLVIMIIVMIVGVRWLLPKVTREFQLISYAIGAILVVITALFMMGNYITLTGFELVAFFLAFSWLMLLLQNLEKSVMPPVPVYEVNIHYAD